MSTQPLDPSYTKAPEWNIRFASNGWIAEPWYGTPKTARPSVFVDAHKLSEFLRGVRFTFCGTYPSFATDDVSAIYHLIIRETYLV